MSNDNNECWWDNHRQYLWQAMGREHLDGAQEVSDEEWDLFVQHHQGSFAEACSEIASNFWIAFQAELEWKKTRGGE